MKRFFFTIFIVALFNVPLAYGAFLKSPRPIADRYIVVLKGNVPSADVDTVSAALTRRFGGRRVAVMNHAIRAFGVRMTEAQARALSHDPQVALVEEDSWLDVSSANNALRERRASSFSNAGCPLDTGGYFLCTYATDVWWNLDRLDNRGILTGTRAYAYASDGTGVRAYVIDTGIYATHSEFDVPTRVEAGANMTVDTDVTDAVTRNDEEPAVFGDFTPANNPCGAWRPTVDDLSSHGTKVASVLGGTTSGVAKNVTLVPVKVIPCPSVPGQITRAPKLAIARGLDWVVADMQGRGGRAVVSMSVFADIATRDVNSVWVGDEVCEDGAGGYTNCVAALENEINNVVAANIPVVVSANNQNNGNCSTTPARLGYGGTVATTHHTITVGATQYSFTAQQDQRWESSTTVGSNFGPCVSIWAPGANIRVASGQGSTSFLTQSGTSFAAPFVAGVVARILQQHPSYTPDDVWTELVNGAGQRWNPSDFDLDPSDTTNGRLVYIVPDH